MGPGIERGRQEGKKVQRQASSMCTTHFNCLAIVAILAFSCNADRSHYWKPDAVELQSRYNVTVLNADPLMLQFDNFLTDAECDHLIALGKPIMQRSTAGLTRDVSNVRTSSTAWLSGPEHFSDPILHGIEDKISEILKVPVQNQEHFQVLKYLPGQFYKAHHDHIPEHANMPCGSRLATFFLYLTDVTAGGGTNFDLLNLVVQPKRGRAALWFNLDTNTLQQDPRTRHEASPVIEGEKWAANKWVHVDNFVDNWKKGLTG